MEKQTIICIIGLIFILISLFFFIISLVISYFNEKVKGYKNIKGKILESSLIKVEDSYAVDTDIYNSTSGTKYKSNIKYEYVINNESYISDRIYSSNLNNMFSTSRTSKKLIEKYYKNKTVDVYLNPDNNNDTFLIKKIPVNYKLFLFIVFLLTGIFIILFRYQIENYI